MDQNKYSVLRYPNKFLSKKAQPFDFDAPIMDPKELEGILVKEMIYHGGIGLAATQLGIDAQAFAIGDDENAMVVFNPIILEKSAETDAQPEGCLSFPGVKLYVERPLQIHVEFQDRDRKTHAYWVKGMDARVFMHEYSHLHGITFKDEVSKFKWDRAKNKLLKV